MQRFSSIVLLTLLGAASAVAEEVVVSQKDKAFSESEVHLQAGDSIRFRNDDRVVHHIFSSSPGNEFEVKSQLPGGEDEIVFEKPGTVEVRCAIHPGMRLSAHVEGPSQETPAKGSDAPPAAASEEEVRRKEP